jgi:uncharacterized protein (DUF2249 family)
MNAKRVTLDVRDDIRNGREPFTKIMSAAAELRVGDQLLLIAPFEPVPLFRVLERQGFQHAAQPAESGDWEVLFTRQTEQGAADAPPPANPPCAATVVEVDARGLEPPQPMVKILEALAALPAGADLRARTDRRPVHLYPHLEERGFAAESEEQSDGSFITHIRGR